MGGGPSQMPAKEDCFPGTDTPMSVTDRHFVLGTKIKPSFGGNVVQTVFGTGCFWGTEKGFWRMPKVHSSAVGYVGGYTLNPTYDQVCSGRTGHNEVVRVAYDPADVAFTDLLRWFWESHDPTQGFGQGNDRGTQYRSGIYCDASRPEQKILAEASKRAYQDALSAAGKKTQITTEIVVLDPAKFYYAEDYHQQYLAKPGARPYCSAQPTGVSLPPSSTWPGLDADIQKANAEKLPETFWREHAPVPGCSVVKESDAQLRA